MFDIYAEITKQTALHLSRLHIVRTEHEHLLRKNYGSFCAFGHDWRTEQAAHERDVRREYRDSLPSEREQFERSDNRARMENVR